MQMGDNVKMDLKKQDESVWSGFYLRIRTNAWK
jgi:hypothetical protein